MFEKVGLHNPSLLSGLKRKFVFVDAHVIVYQDNDNEAWKYLGNFGIKMLCKLFNCIMNTEEMPSAWRQSILIPIFK